MRYDFRKCYKNQLAYFSVPSNCRLLITRKMESDVEASKYINNFYHLIKVLLNFRTATEIIGYIMENSKISEIFRHYSFVNPSEFNNTYIFSSNLACEIVKKVNAKSQLESIIKDTLEAIIKKKAVTFDLTQ